MGQGIFLSGCDVYEELLRQQAVPPSPGEPGGPTMGVVVDVITDYKRTSGPSGLMVTPRFPRCVARRTGLDALAVEPAAANAAIRESATRLIAEAAAQYGRAAVKLGVVQAAGAALDWAAGTANVQGAVRGSFLSVGKNLYKWATDERSWAEAGKNPVGGAFSWERWADNGRAYLKTALSIAGEAWNASAYNILASTVVETARQANPTTPSAWPTWLKVGVGAAALVAGAYVVNTGLRVKREAAAAMSGLPRRPRRKRRNKRARR